MDKFLFYKGIVENLPLGYAYHRIICNSSGEPIDYEFLEVNTAFEKLTGLKKDDILGKKVKQILPDIRNENFDWVTFYGEVALKGEVKKVKKYLESLQKWFEVEVFSPEQGYFITLFKDISEEIHQLKELEKSFKYEQLLYNVSTLAVNCESFDSFMNEALRLMGETLKFSRIYTFRHNHENNTMTNTYEWVAPGISSQIDYLKEIPEEDVFWWTQRLKANQIINYSNIEKIPDEGTKKILRPQKIKSILVVPVFIKKKYYGFIGFDDCQVHRQWSGEDVKLLFSIAGIITQVVLRKKAEEALYTEKEWLRVTLHSIGDGVIVTNNKGQVVMHNKVAEELTGWSQEEAQGRPLTEVFNIINEKTGLKCENPVEKALQTGLIVGLTNHTALIAKDGKERIITDSAAPIKDQEGNIMGVVLVFRDVTEEKIKEEEILYLSYHDKLTGLYNRTFFEEELFRLDRKDQLPLSLIMGDVNGLKMTNDVFGHHAGDELLKNIAQIIKNSCRSQDIVARWGGDEFVILLPKTEEKTVNQICECINENCQNSGQTASHLSISLGYATKVNIDEDIIRVLQRAEDFMYKRKLLESKSLRSSIISSIKKTLFERSNETEEHANRLSHYCKKIGLAMGLSKSEINELELLSMLHDIGKIAIKDSILTKPAKLTDEEWIEMKKHPEIGYRIAQSAPELSQIADYILCHHERWDGKGYPQGLQKEKIPLLARILAVVDAFDAMTNDRPYQKALKITEAKRELERNAGTQFDPEIVAIFLEKVLDF